MALALGVLALLTSLPEHACGGGDCARVESRAAHRRRPGDWLYGRTAAAAPWLPAYVADDTDRPTAGRRRVA